MQADQQPCVFISYSHDNPAHKRWVAALALDLLESGIDVMLDQWDTRPGDNLAHYMETSITRANRVLMVCTERYVEKADSGKGGVGYEALIITGEIFERGTLTAKFIPIIRQAAGKTSVPSFARSLHRVDLSSDDGEASEEGLGQIVAAVFERSLATKPAIGANPFGTAAKPHGSGSGSTGSIQIPARRSRPRFEVLQQQVADSLLKARNRLGVRNYEEAEDILVQMTRQTPHLPEIYWLLHLVYFERSCSTPQPHDRKTYAGKCMDAYRECTDLDPTFHILPPTEYQVLEPLGFGGLSHVYMVQKGNNTYAAKLVRQELLANVLLTQEYVRNLPKIKEMTEGAAREGMDSIAKIEAFEATSDRIVIVYEYVEGVSLRDFIKARQSDGKSKSLSLSPDDVAGILRLLVELCHAVQFGHDRHIHHLDLSPSNVLLSVEETDGSLGGQVKIIDFDSARIATGAEGMSVTRCCIMGTLDYVAPEVVEDPGRAGPQSDVYSLGMLARTLFCRSVRSQKSPSQLSAAVSPIVDEIIACATEADPHDRHTTVSEMRACFQAVLDKSPDKKWVQKDITVGICTMIIVLAYAVSVFLPAFLGWEDGKTSYLAVATLVGLVFATPLVISTVSYGLLRVDSLFQCRWQRSLTHGLLLSWIVILMLVRLYPSFCLLLVSVAVLLAAVRFSLYLPYVEGSDAAKQLIRNGVLLQLLGTFLGLAGFLSLRVMSDSWVPSMLMSYTVIFLIFGLEWLRHRRYDWHRTLGSFCRKDGWDGLTSCMSQREHNARSVRPTDSRKRRELG